MTESIPVEARFKTDGSLRPIAFEWQDRRFEIESHGRQWEENGEHHFLVMVSGDQVFELVYLQEDNQWRLKRSPKDFNRHPSI
jgi:hypothetical protein